LPGKPEPRIPGVEIWDRTRPPSYLFSWPTGIVQDVTLSRDQEAWIQAYCRRMVN
jgi:hypothetical protein